MPFTLPFNEQYMLENSLYANATEKAALEGDKQRVASALMFNFFGMLGVLNAASPVQKRTLIKFLQKDKKLRIDTIDDTNHDISLSVKLAHTAGFFMNDAVVNEITRFLVKLKAGQVDHIDSTIVGKWANLLKPDFMTSLPDAKLRTLMGDFRMDEGKTIDISRFAVRLKSIVNRYNDTGDFKVFAKKFIGLQEVPVGTATTAAPAPAAPVAGVKLNYYQRQKLKKQQAAAVGSTPVPDPVATTSAPVKLNYYQRQKLMRQQAAGNTAVDQAEIERKRLEAEQAAAAEKARQDAERAAAEKARLDKIEAERIAKEKAAAIKSISKDDIMKMFGYMTKGDYIRYIYSDQADEILDELFDYKVVPKIYADTFEIIRKTMITAYDMQSITRDEVSDKVESIKQSFEAIQQLTTHRVLMKDVMAKVIARSNSFQQNNETGRMIYATFVVDDNLTNDYIDALFRPVNNTTKDIVAGLLQDFAPSLYNKAVDLMAASPALLYDKDGMVEGCALESLVATYGNNNVYPWSFQDRNNPTLASMTLDVIAKANISVKSFAAAKRARTYALGTYIVGFGGSTQVENLSAKTNAQYAAWIGDYIREHVVFNDDKILTSVLTTYSHKHKYFSYNPDESNRGGTLPSELHDLYADDIEKNGWENSKLYKETNIHFDTSIAKSCMDIVGVNIDTMVANNPEIPSCTYFKVASDGLHAVSTSSLTNLIKSGSNIINSCINLLSVSGGQADSDRPAISAALLAASKANPNTTKSIETGRFLMDLLPYLPADDANAWLKHAHDNDNGWIAGKELYEDINRDEKQKYVDMLIGLVQDGLGTDAEPALNKIIGTLPQYVIQKMRASLVGASTIIKEIDQGDIKPFGKIDSSRLKKMFVYNDIDMSAVVGTVVDKKKKSETYTQYFARAQQAVSSAGGLLSKEKVSPDTISNVKNLNRIIIKNDHAGKHGDTYPKIKKVFDANVEYPEFWDFRTKKPKDGTITPAYHGTGGIAAGMILRYGFRVIKASDSSVVGRMLGDGIYFSNKIDKATQYVNNGGYSRAHGQKGYILQLDTNLGKKGVDYNVAGGVGSNIRSPEWCVMSPREQLRIIKAYEVELTSKKDIDNYLAEANGTTGLMGFKSFIREEVMNNAKPTTRFVFRDGLIPIINKKSLDVTYVDFEEALKKHMIRSDLYEVTSQGPSLVFQNTKVQETYDERYASQLIGEGLQLYKELFVRDMFPLE